MKTTEHEYIACGVNSKGYKDYLLIGSKQPDVSGFELEVNRDTYVQEIKDFSVPNTNLNAKNLRQTVRPG